MNLEDEIRRALRRGAEGFEPTTSMANVEAAARIEAKAVVRRRRISHGMLALALTSVAVALGLQLPRAVGESDPSRVTVKEASPPATPSAVTTPPVTRSPSPRSTDPAVQVVRCASIPNLPDGEINTSADIERGLLTISSYDPALGRDREYTIRYRDDATCKDDPELAAIIRGATRQ